MPQSTVPDMSTLAAPSLSSRASEPSKGRKSHNSNQPRRKTRVVRRRGRGKDGLGSDDEFVREVGTDSDTEDDMSTSDFDSDTEPVSEGAVVDGRSRPLTPSTSDSPQSHNKDLPNRIDDNPQPFFTQPSTWEDMVAEESTHGPAELPIIDFADFNSEAISNGHVPRPLSHKSKRSLDGSRDRSPRSETKERDEIDIDRRQSPSRRSRSSASKRLAGQSARQAYQQRLENDPSFVPTVGGFWGHDERLLDKDLRSLSGWWRGRWQNRGRGRGFAMRGRGGHNQGPPFHEGDPNSNGEDLPPIERPWTHDGFEEMKRKEEQRRATLQQHQQANQTRGGHGGKVGFVPSRGGRGGPTRGGLISSPSRSSTTFAPGRVWYTMKPELMWTKQHEAFLFFDSSTKPRKSHGPSYRVKLPGRNAYVVQSPAHIRQDDAKWEWPRVNDGGDSTYTVRIPKAIQTEKAIEPPTTVEETSLDDIFTVRPNLVTPVPIPMPGPVAGPSNVAAALPDKAPSSSASQGQKAAQSEQALLPQLENLSVVPQSSDEARLTRTEEAVLKKSSPGQSPTKQPSNTNDQRPVLPPLQTVFTPPPGTSSSPAYAAAYPYAPALPHGVALNAHGMPYELATGRPVILAPPPPMFTPRPMMPHMAPGAVPFIPHMSPDFMSQSNSHTPPVNGFMGPTTGAPLFSLPRQTRIEIRAPTDEFDGKGSRKGQSRQSNTVNKTPTVPSPSQSLDLSSQPFYPTLMRPAETASTSSYASSETRDSQVNTGDPGNHQHADPHLVSYPPYQPYYYPESYGYYPYMDMTQVGQYDIYSSDPRGTQGTVYY